jgi:plasmid stabilization system protein ParE
VPDTREAVVHPNYIMVYRIESETITILRVLHAAQRWPSAE